jgi:hypothetical protein
MVLFEMETECGVFEIHGIMFESFVKCQLSLRVPHLEDLHV